MSDRKFTMRRWLWLSIIVVLLDQATKWLVMATLKPFEAIPLLPNLNLTLAYNEGAAFSLLAEAGGWQRWVLAGAAVAVSAGLWIWLGRLKPAERTLAVALSLILGGAVGNLIDRAILGHVIDFIQVYLPFIPLAIFNPWPAFNIADSAITVGAAILILHTLLVGDGKDTVSPDPTKHV
jgi:signal peptidase II